MTVTRYLRPPIDPFQRDAFTRHADGRANVDFAATQRLVLREEHSRRVDVGAMRDVARRVTP